MVMIKCLDLERRKRKTKGSRQCGLSDGATGALDRKDGGH